VCLAIYRCKSLFVADPVHVMFELVVLRDLKTPSTEIMVVLSDLMTPSTEIMVVLRNMMTPSTDIMVVLRDLLRLWWC